MQEQEKQKQQKIKVVNIVTMVRVRPLLSTQTQFKQSIKCKDDKTLQINLSGQIRKQNVQKVFSQTSTQREVFQSMEPIIEKCGAGFNVTIFTYGQTGSGKTHTMFGSDWNNIIKKNQNNTNGKQNDKKFAQQTFIRSIQQDQNHSGLIPRSIHYLFNSLITKRRKYIKVYCSFVQLYNQSMLDLLEDDAKLAKQKKMLIHENANDGIYIEGLNQMTVQDPDQCLQLMKRGERNRIVRQTSMNIKSSRSHTIFQLLIEEVFPSKKTFRRMKLNLCDLAGSQKINKSEKMQNDHFEELKNINLSLTTLGKVISSLSEKTKAPYRQSKLTRLLQDSLGGNTYTAIIATVTTKSSCLDESINTLKFLQRAKQIKSSIISKQMVGDNPQIKNLQKQISYLKDILKMKRNGTNVIDLDLNEKYQRLQQQNAKLKELVDKELVEKLMKQNNQLKIKLQQKNNDDLSESFMKSGSTFIGLESQNDYRKKDLKTRTIEHSGQSVSNRDQQVHSQYRSSSFNGLRKKAYETNSKLNGRSTQGSSNNNNGTNTKISMFPSLGRKSATYSTNKILDRIQQIEKVKQTNRIKLQKELQNMENKNSLEGKAAFARISKYSNKYRY